MIRGGSRGGCGGCTPPPPAIFNNALGKLSFSIISNLFITIGAHPWRDVSPPIIRQHPPQYFQVPKLGVLAFTSFWAKNWASGNVTIFFFLVFTSFWAKNWTSADVSILLNHPPQYRKMVDFAKSPPMLNIDLYPCS